MINRWLFLPLCLFTNLVFAEYAFMVVSGAYDIKSMEMTDNLYHISYRVDIEYPKLAIGEELNDALKENGWKHCAEKNPGWRKYEDSANPKEPRCIHRYGVSYYDGDELMRIVMTYQSNADSEQSCQDLPDTNQQHVVISIYDNVDIESEKKRLELVCEP